MNKFLASNKKSRMGEKAQEEVKPGSVSIRQ
jgi:hypothetical protein